MEMTEVSEKIKAKRLEKKLTLKELGEKTGLSISFLSQVERGTSSLAITSLKKIADALEVAIIEFFEDLTNHNYLVKVDQHKPFRIEGSRAEYTRLGGQFSGRSLEPLLVRLGPGKFKENAYSHPGEEFYYVIDGVVIFNVDGKEYLVKKGDSIHFPSHIPHIWENPLDNDAIVLSVTTPVIF